MSPTHTLVHGVEANADGKMVIGVTPQKGRIISFGKTGGVEGITPAGHEQLSFEQFEARYNIPADAVKAMPYSSEGQPLDPIIAAHQGAAPATAPSRNFDPSGNNM